MEKVARPVKMCECGHADDEHDDAGCRGQFAELSMGELNYWTCSCELFDWDGDER